MREQLYKTVNLLDEFVKRHLRQGDSIATIINRSSRSSVHILPIVEKYLNMKDTDRQDRHDLYLGREYLHDLKEEFSGYVRRDQRAL